VTALFAVIDRLRTGFRITRPRGDGPFPVVVLMHGCGGNKGLQDLYAEVAVATGWAALVLDSYAPREISRAAAYATVCTGLRLQGRERAGDLYAALAWLRAQPWADAGRFAAAGWSHGAWSIMDALASGPDAGRFARIEGLGPDALAGLAGAFLVYPWSGVGSLTGRRGWAKRVKALMILGGRDSVSGTYLPRRAAERVRAGGGAIEVLVFPEATHAFDEAHGVDPRFRFSPERFAEASALFAAFLADL
jgi:dienelactone hydrolase